jgi:Amt family ammonium transporter
MGALSWMTMSWWLGGKPSIIGAASGAVAGVVAITPASGVVKPMPAVIIGLGAGVFCYLALKLRSHLKFDDSLDVWACHGIGGTWGALATGLFATVAINVAGKNGLFYGHPGQVWTQLMAIAVVWAYSFVVTFSLLKVMDRFMGVNVTENEEEIGLDVSQHGERAYEA